MLTLKKINIEFERRGFKEKLAKGDRNYFFFKEGGAPTWTRPVVFVKRVNDLTIQEWMIRREIAATSANLMPK